MLFFQDWKLTNFIDVSYELGLLDEDVKVSHALRNFRNYIHPYEQVSGFNLIIISEICWRGFTGGVFHYRIVEPFSNNLVEKDRN